jgi:hypothetical protein
MTLILQQVVGWMKTALTLLGNARAYVSCDLHSEEARALYDELCNFGAERPLPTVRWEQGVEDSIRIVEDELQHYTSVHPPVGAAIVALTAFEAAKSRLQVMLSRGSYKDKNSASMDVDAHGNFPPSTKCYHGEDMVGEPEKALLDYKACWEELEVWLADLSEYIPMANDPPSLLGAKLEEHLKDLKRTVELKMKRLSEMYHKDACTVHGEELPCRECMGLEILRLKGEIP